MKRLFTLLGIFCLLTVFLTGCGGSSTDTADTAIDSSDDKTIVVGASPTPHAEILNAAKEQLEKDGYTLEVQEYTDYVTPNQALESGDLDANYFQHLPYLEDFNSENGTDLVSVGTVHYEPFGLYAGKTATIEELPDGATIAVPNDTTNEARALLLLEENGLITLKDGVGLQATKNDIVENPKNIQIQELEAAQLARSLEDVDMAVINGNYALDAGLNVKDALATEKEDSEAAQTYANIVAVKSGDENSEKIQALIKALQSDDVKAYIEETYNGAVVPIVVE